MKHVPCSLSRGLGARTLALLLALILSPLVFAAITPTTIDNAPIVTTTAAQAKPNVMLLMDTSDSMARTHMPDEIESVTRPTSIGYKSSKCNVLYYDPNKKYDLPKDENGGDFPVPSFTSAPYTGFANKLLAPTALQSSSTDLSQYFLAYDNTTLELPRSYVDGGSIPVPSPYDPTGVPLHYPGVPAYYYVYTPPGSGSPDALGYASAACAMSDPGTAYVAPITTPAGGTWKRVIVGSTTGSATVGPDERANFAMWYSFYRTRLSLIKSAASLAFTPLGNTYRVGFLTVEPKASRDIEEVDPLRYLPMADFNASNRVTWFKKLFSQTAAGASPAREGLARVGRYYGGMKDGINQKMNTGLLVNGILDADPVQYACQQNFTIMTTDGYWNAHTETTGIGGPQKLLIGTNSYTNWVGQQDGQDTCTFTDPACMRPIYDGVSSSHEVDTTKESIYVVNACPGGGFTKTTKQSTSTVNRYTKNSIATQKQTVSYSLSSQQTTAQTKQTSRYDTQITQTKKRVFTDRRHIVQEAYVVWQNVDHTQITTQQYFRSAAQTVARSFETHEVIQNYEKTVNQWQKSSQQASETRSQWQEGTNQFKYGAVQWLRATYQVNVLNGTGETFSVPSAEPCIIGTEPLKGTTPSNLACAVVVSYGGGGPVSNPAGDSNSTALRYDNSSTCAGLVAANTGTWNAGVYLAIDATSPYIHTECKAGPATAPYGPVASCPLATASPSISNSWTTVTCDQSPTPTVPVASCTLGEGTITGPGQVVYTCTHTINISGGVAVCTYATSPYVEPGTLTTFTCTQPGTTNFPMGPSPACAPADGVAHTDSNFITTVCSKLIDDVKTFVPSCTPDPGSSSNGYTVVTCSAQNTVSDTIVADATCQAHKAAWADPTSTITCTQKPAGPDAAGNVPEPSCPAASGGFEYACTPGPSDQPVATAVAASACPAGVGTQPGGGSFPYVVYTCSLPPGPNNTPAAPPTYVDPADCNAGTSGTVTTTCNNVHVSGPTVVDPSTCALTPGRTVDNSNANHYVTTCTKHNTAPDFEVDLASCVVQLPNFANGWETKDCTTTYDNTQPRAWGFCVPTQVVAHISPGVDDICEIEGPLDSFVTACNPTGSGDDNTPSHWNVACSAPAVVASPDGFTGAHNVDPSTCVDGSVSGASLVAHCTPDDASTPYPAATPVAACHPGYDATGLYGPPGIFWTCQPGAATAAAHPVAASDPACVLNSGGVPQVDPGDATITTTCTKSDDGGFVGSTPIYVSAADCAAAATAAPLSTITCTSVPLPNVGADPVTCVPGTTSTTYPYDLTTSCSGPTPVLPAPTGPCTAVATPTSPNFQTTTCGFTPAVTTSETSCAPTYSSPGVPGVDPVTGDLTTCTPDSTAVQFSIKTTTTVTTIDTVNGVVGTPSVNPSSATVAGDGVCYASAADFPPLVQPSCPPSAPCKNVTPAPGGSSNSLADVAQYYYETDLRPAGNPSGSPNHIVSDGSVHPVGTGVEADTANYVHMTTFVVGLGVSGTLNYDPNYKTGAGDFGAIRSGAKPWPIWPDPAAATGTPPFLANGNFKNQYDWNNPKSIDDYWHTAVNGRGTYFSAVDPSSVVLGLGTALSTVAGINGAGAADAVSNLQPVDKDNFAFSTGYVTNVWTGDLRAFEINLGTGALEPTERWSATTLLNSRVHDGCDNRDIYLLDKSNAAAVNGLVEFTLTTSRCNALGLPLAPVTDGLTTTAELNAVGDASSTTPKIPSLSQYFNMTAAQKTAATSSALVNYLRGQRGDEIVATSTTKLFRARAGVLGDIVDSQPVYVQKPFANYLDPGYGNFQLTWVNRPPVVYVGGNDGMLHAFNAVVNPLVGLAIDTNAGMEKWAVIPSTVLPNMWQLADSAYVAPANHRFFVDGTPVAADIDIDGGGHWKTILVGGLNAGGKGYYAMDVTDPTVARPKALWEFKQDTAQCPSASSGPYSADVAHQSGITGDCHLGLTFGKPVVTKLAGRWVVMFASGYNNDDGVGYLYVVDAYTGNLIQKIATPAVSGVDAGLAQINNYVNNVMIDNTTVRAYGGDLLGRIWRFDFAGAGSAQLIGTAEDNSNNAQPITIRPELAELNGKPMLFVGTGQLLGSSDIGNLHQQSVYGIVDPLTSTSGAIYSSLRTSLNKLKMTQIEKVPADPTTWRRTVDCATAGTCTNTAGWVVDFPNATTTNSDERGERVNVEMKLVLGTLVVGSNVPTDDVCTVGGHSWYNYLNFSDGQAVSGADLSNPTDPLSRRIVSEYLAGSIIVGFNVIQLPPPPGSSNPRFVTEIHTSDGLEHARKLPVAPAPFQGKRISWREIVQP